MMRKLTLAALAVSSALVLNAPSAHAWGKRGHEMIDRAALEAIPADGPVFLQEYEDYITASAGYPDAWRGNDEGFSKIAEDPNHGWFREQFTFLDPIPRSRYEFVLALFKHREAIKDSDPAAAARTNVRWTGTLPYAAMEAYERLIVCMRQVRAARASGGDASVPERHCAFHAIRLGHYIGDGGNPMHDSVHADGWLGDNPKGYTTSRSVHGRFESRFVDAMDLSAEDVTAQMPARAHGEGDMFDAVLAYLDAAGDKVGYVYELEKRDQFGDFSDADVRELILTQTGSAAAMLRDMLCRAWAESGQDPAKVDPSPIDFANPAFNPETGSAPAGL
ncbi:nuclease [Novosphingobium sp. MBES04]|uniref:nuclease n=1 Tax=Novosphingobium sp. MBES04 TaxID=1206458 RepID=UPI000572F6F0|nr:nuclease [Novosphingobium sp. MBES04]GAM07580.1 nuclease [Novosphingobium sp. MBES04]